MAFLTPLKTCSLTTKSPPCLFSVEVDHLVISLFPICNNIKHLCNLHHFRESAFQNIARVTFASSQVTSNSRIGSTLYFLTTWWRRINWTIQPFNKVYENLHKIIPLHSLVAHRQIRRQKEMCIKVFYGN